LKIERDNPRHWVYAGAFAITLIAVVIARPFTRRRGDPLLLLYGHKLNGNLLALREGLGAEDDLDVAYLTMDPVYHRLLKGRGEPSVLAFSWKGLKSLCRARCIVTDHGPQLMAWLPTLTDIRFVDVWHGIPFKGWSSQDFRTLRRYDQVFVTSDLLKSIYVDRFGFRTSQVRVTGYARTDGLVRRSAPVDQVKAELGMTGKKVVLFAPTWTHGADRSEIPFGLDPSAFYSDMADVARSHGAVFVVRAHLNTRLDVQERDSLRFVPHETYPDTESLLQATDVLVCDWSSIAFDFLLLDRPTVFLEVPSPFAHGFTLDPSYRFGAIASDADELVRCLDRYLADPERYQTDVGERPHEVEKAVYGDMADGMATSRCIEALRELLFSQ
jgi:CDP-glycerol glycerophosphotransferase